MWGPWSHENFSRLRICLPTLRPMSIKAKRLHGSGYHLVRKYASTPATLCSWGPTSPTERTAAPTYQPMSIRMDQDTTWYGSTPRPMRHCVRWEPSSPSTQRGTAAPTFQPTALAHSRGYPTDNCHPSSLKFEIDLFPHRLCENSLNIIL